MFTDEELQQMMESTNDESQTTTDVQAPVAEVNETAPEDTTTTDAQAPVAEVNETAPEDNSEANSEVIVMDKLTEDNSVTVSDIILSNVDKHIKMVLLNNVVTAANADTDVTNYIVYVNTDKKIPCVYDCEGLRIPTSSVKNDDGTWKVTSIEGRRSGFVIKCGADRDLVMTKNFVYDCEFDSTGKIVAVKEYNRKNTITTVTENSTDVFDDAVLLVRNVLPKIVKSGKYTTIEQIREQVKLSYDSVNDINAMFKIVNLRLQIGC